MTSSPGMLGERLVVRRTVAAPPDVVYRVWTEPRYARQWSWGAEHDTIAVDIDLRVGGIWRQEIRNRANGETWWFDGEFRAIDPGKRLVHTFHWRNDRGEDHGTSLVAIDFIDDGGNTEVVITHTELRDEQLRRGTEKGWEDVSAVIARLAEQTSRGQSTST